MHACTYTHTYTHTCKQTRTVLTRKSTRVQDKTCKLDCIRINFVTTFMYYVVTMVRLNHVYVRCSSRDPSNYAVIFGACKPMLKRASIVAIT